MVGDYMKNVKRVYDFYSRGRVIGELIIYGEKTEELRGYFKLQDNLEDNDVLWWLDEYHRGIRLLGEKYVRDFVTYRVSERSRPQLEQKMREAGIEEYDELILFLYANGRCCMDTYYIKPKE